MSVDGRKETLEKIPISLFEESTIFFEADKLYSLPSVPVIIKWDVKNAHKVCLDHKEVSMMGEIVVELEEETRYTLSVIDEFGTQEQYLTIRMLPLPVIKALMLPTPDWINNINVVNQVPKLKVEVSAPVLSFNEPDFVTSIPEPVHLLSVPYPNIQIQTSFSKKLWNIWNYLENEIVKRINKNKS